MPCDSTVTWSATERHDQLGASDVSEAFEVSEEFEVFDSAWCR